MVGVLVVLIVLPAFGSQFFVEFVMTRALILGVAASTLIFLSAYGGMVSLAQLLLVRRGRLRHRQLRRRGGQHEGAARSGSIRGSRSWRRS